MTVLTVVKKTKLGNGLKKVKFLAALSSSRSVVVGSLVGPSVGRSVRPLVGHLCEKYLMLT